MDLTNEVAAGGSEAISIAVAPAPVGETPLGVREAARNLGKWRQSRDKHQPRPPVSGEGGDHGDPPPAPEQEATDATAAGEGEAPVEESSGAEDADEPLPIEPQASWSEQDKELFASLPRATQERLAERERSREGEASQRRKVLEADRASMEQARQKYEATLPQLLAALQQQQSSEFADVTTAVDIERLAREDLARYVKWDLQQKQIAQVTREILGAQARQQSEQQRRFAEFAQRIAGKFTQPAREGA
jgi:hypothetical protein